MNPFSMVTVSDFPPIQPGETASASAQRTMTKNFSVDSIKN